MKLVKSQRRELRYFLQYVQKLKNCKNIEKIVKLVLDESSSDSQLLPKFSALKRISLQFTDTDTDNDEKSLAANFLLAFFYENGLGTYKDVKQAFEYYKTLAEKNYMFALWQLGTLHEDGNGVVKDDRAAFRFYEDAAERGHAFAQNAVGDYYRWGRAGMKQDSRKAEDYFVRAASQNCSDALNNLGCLYSDGARRGIIEDRKALDYYYKAAQDPDAEPAIHVNLADCCLYGVHGVDDDNDIIALEHYRIAAKENDPDAIYNIGWMYQNGSGGLEEDIKQATEHYKISMDLGCLDGKYAYACLLLRGVDGVVDKDCDLAFNYLSSAAKEGHIQSQVKIGYCHEFGLGVKQDTNEALNSYKFAIENGRRFPYRGVEHDLKNAKDRIEYLEKNKLPPKRKYCLRTDGGTNGDRGRGGERKTNHDARVAYEEDVQDFIQQHNRVVVIPSVYRAPPPVIFTQPTATRPKSVHNVGSPAFEPSSVRDDFEPPPVPSSTASEFSRAQPVPGSSAAAAASSAASAAPASSRASEFSRSRGTGRGSGIGISYIRRESSRYGNNWD